jgi:uncharacterized protein YndB with AHSA1/START domain
VPVITRERTVPAPPEEVWEVVTDPYRLPTWWPGVTRVEDVEPGAWTMVLSSPRGKAVRADYSLESSEPLREQIWRQELEESPFERIMSSSLTRIGFEAEGSATRVRMRAEIKLRGFARFGGVQVRRASGRLLDGALDGLSSAFGGAR